MKQLRKLLAIMFACSITSLHANELKSFGEIYNSLRDGKNISMIINFDNCNPKPPVANIVVYTTPTAVMLRKTYLQFSNSPLTTNNPSFPQKPVLENVTYKINNTDNVDIVVRIITLPDYTIVKETNSACPLNTAIRVFNGVTL